MALRSCSPKLPGEDKPSYEKLHDRESLHVRHDQKTNSDIQ